MASKLSKKNGRLLLRIGQVNIGGSKTTTEELKQIMNSKKLDVVLLQEPYCMDQKIRGLGLNVKVVEDSDRAPWTRITKVQAGIVITKTDVMVTKLQQFSNNYFTCIQVSTNNDRLYLVSAYFQFSDEIEPYIDFLDKIVAALHGNKIIIGIDVNANSPMWHSNQLDPKGEEMENFILQRDLIVLNRANQPLTF